MSWDPLLKFFIESHEGIAEVIELEERARGKIAAAVANFLRTAIASDIENWGLQDARCGVEHYKDEHYVWWADSRFYNIENEVGPCFDVYLSATALIDPVDDDSPFLLLEFEGENKRGKKINPQLTMVTKAVEDVKSKTRQSRIQFRTPWRDSSNFLAFFEIKDVLNLVSLRDQEKLANDFVNEARKFTKAFAERFEI